MPTILANPTTQPQAIESEDDRKLLVQFYVDAVQDEQASAEQGRPIFRDQTMIKIVIPGSRDEYVAPATRNYQTRFPRHWAAFQNQVAQVVDGTPLEEVPFLTKSQIKELKGVNCLTLEQLAGMSDANAAHLMGLTKVRLQAKEYIAAAKSAAPITKLQAQLDERTNEVQALREELQEFKAALAAQKALKKA